MYFKERENTNIDSEFENSNKFNFNFNFQNLNLKPILFIAGGIILLIIIIFIFMSLNKNSNEYTIELIGGDKITINLGEDYIEPGYKAYNKDNENVTDLVQTTGVVDTSSSGEYEIIYFIGKTNKVRYVTVAKSLEETYIYLKGKVNMYLEVGEIYTEPGYEVYDSIDKNLTSKVKVNGSVNTSKPGTYTITYTVVNSKNITTTVKRTVIVVKKGQKPQN